jgi:glucosamine--fructose-6-phosphate aminotransferase (isomerizing)
MVRRPTESARSGARQALCQSWGAQGWAGRDIAGHRVGGRRRASAGRPTIAVTNVAGSDLARAAEHVIELRAGPERSVAATKTYTAELVALAMLSVALAGDSPGEDRSLSRIPAALARALESSPAVSRIAGEVAHLDRAIVVGRGFGFPTALEWALKLKELGRVLADPYSAADMAHGPLALVRPRGGRSARTPGEARQGAAGVARGRFR